MKNIMEIAQDYGLNFVSWHRIDQVERFGFSGDEVVDLDVIRQGIIENMNGRHLSNIEIELVVKGRRYVSERVLERFEPVKENLAELMEYKFVTVDHRRDSLVVNDVKMKRAFGPVDAGEQFECVEVNFGEFLLNFFRGEGDEPLFEVSFMVKPERSA